MSNSSEKKAQPLVSVIVPAYNAERWIGETIRSVQAQTYSNLEIIVVDDGSPDNLSELVGEMARQDRRIRLIQKKNGGLPAARNTGFEHAQGAYVAPLDADDLWKPQKIEKQVACIESGRQSGQSVGMVYCWSQTVDENGRILRPGTRSKIHEGNVLSDLLRENFIGNGSVPLMDRELVLKVEGCSEKLTGYGCEDWELYLKLAAVTGVCAVPEYLVGYRQVSTSMSRNFDKMIKAHEMMLSVLSQAGWINIKSPQCRDGRTGLMLSMLPQVKPHSGRFWKLLSLMIRHDCFFMFRPFCMQLIFMVLKTKIMRLLGLSDTSISGKEF
jgi:glycosyltransferase involved in cell wall biosynthesis